MVTNKNQKIQEYAELLVKVGLNVQKGQTVCIRTPVECADFARLCAEEAYKAGCKDIVTVWSDDILSRLRYTYADDSVFDSFPQWETEKFNYIADNKAAVLNIYAADPEALRGIDSDKISRSSKARGNALKKFYAAQMSNEFQWCIGSIPIPSWSTKVFPELSANEADDALWEAIFKTVRITGDGNSVRLWREHIVNNAKLCDKLNAYNFKFLEYKNSIGTDFICELPENHMWLGGAETTKDGINFVANMPTEEIFTAPKKNGVNGNIVASKPLCIDGVIVDGIKFTVQNGKIIHAVADSGNETLQKAIRIDEGASYFGEIALVPFDSPISDMNLLFYNTLFDENASCHMAFGEAYPCIKNGSSMTREELDEKGLNYSITHEDFMIGTRDLSIIGTEQNGNKVQIFKDGNFAI